MCITSTNSCDLPGFNDTVEWNLGNPGPLRRGCQEFLRWFWFLQSSHDQASGSQGPEIPGQRAVMGARVDDLTWYPLPGQIGNGNLAVVAHFTTDGGFWIDVLDLPARSIHFIETGMGQTGDKSAFWPEHTGDFLDGSSGILNIHKGHIADDQIKRAIFQHPEVGRVSHMVDDTQWLLRLSCTSTLNERRISIHSGDGSALTREAAAQVAVAAGEVQQAHPTHFANQVK